MAPVLRVSVDTVKNHTTENTNRSAVTVFKRKFGRQCKLEMEGRSKTELMPWPVLKILSPVWGEVGLMSRILRFGSISILLTKEGFPHHLLCRGPRVLIKKTMVELNGNRDI